MIGLVQLGRRHGYDKLKDTLDLALEIGCTDAEAIRHLLESSSLRRSPAQLLEPFQLGELAWYERPLPAVNHYDQLVGEVGR